MTIGVLTFSTVVNAAAATDVDKIAMAVSASQTPGAAVLIEDHGRIVYDRVLGVRNLGGPRVDEHTRFEIGSITKQFTAAAILQLKEKNKLSLSDPLSKYVPEYAHAKEITIEQLLWQESGVPSYTETKAFHQLIVHRNGAITIPKAGTFHAILAMIQKAPLDFAPGSKWAYSNTNYILLGRVVEVASMMPWQRYVRENIFAPAGMTESSFMEDEAHVADFAHGYAVEKRRRLPVSSFNGWAGAAGAIVSTTHDLLAWDHALFSGKIISADDLALMTSPGPKPVSATAGYGFGWMVDSYDGVKRIWHNGGTLGFSAANYYYPEQHQWVIALVNNGTANADALATIAFEMHNPQVAAAALKPAAGENLAITARAKAAWADFAQGRIDRSQFTERVNRVLTPQFLSSAKDQVASLGQAQSWIFQGTTKRETGTDYAYRISFSSGTTLTLHFVIDAQNKINGFALDGG